MALKSILDSTEGLPEAIAAEYTELEDGRFVLDVEGVDDFPNVVGLKKKRDQLLGEIRKKNEALAKYEGVDLEEYERLKNAPSGNEDFDRAKAEWKKTEEKLLGQITAAKNEASETIERERGAARRSIQTMRVMEALTKSDPPGVFDLVGPKLMSETAVVLNEQTNQYEVHVVDAEGQRRYKGTSGEFMTLSDRVAELAKDPVFGRAFAASDRKGSGTPPPGTPRTTGGRRVIPNDPREIGKEENRKAILDGTAVIEGFE